jgi:hypothetical protein
MVQRAEPMPKPAAGQVLISVGSVGIYASELSGFLCYNSLRVPPLIMGREGAGQVLLKGAFFRQRWKRPPSGSKLKVLLLTCCENELSAGAYLLKTPLIFRTIRGGSLPERMNLGQGYCYGLTMD